MRGGTHVPHSGLQTQQSDISAFPFQGVLRRCIREIGRGRRTIRRYAVDDFFRIISFLKSWTIVRKRNVKDVHRVAACRTCDVIDGILRCCNGCLFFARGTLERVFGIRIVPRKILWSIHGLSLFSHSCVGNAPSLLRQLLCRSRRRSWRIRCTRTFRRRCPRMVDRWRSGLFAITL